MLFDLTVVIMASLFIHIYLFIVHVRFNEYKISFKSHFYISNMEFV